jgi:hypothetical protein
LTLPRLSTSFFQLLEQLVAGELAQLLQVALVVGDLQPHVVELRAFEEARHVESVRNIRLTRRRRLRVESGNLRWRRRRDRLAAHRGVGALRSCVRVLHALRGFAALLRKHAHDEDSREHQQRDQHHADHQAAHAVGAHQPAERPTEGEAAEHRRPPSRNHWPAAAVPQRERLPARSVAQAWRAQPQGGALVILRCVPTEREPPSFAGIRIRGNEGYAQQRSRKSEQQLFHVCPLMNPVSQMSAFPSYSNL